MGRKGGWGGRCHTITNIVSDHYHYQPPPLNKQSNGAFMENRCVAVYLLWHPLGHWNLPCKHSALDGRAGKAGMERGSQIKLPFSSTDTSLLGCLVQVSTVHVSGLIPLLLFHRSTSPPPPPPPIFSSPKEPGIQWCRRETYTSLAVRAGTTDCMPAHCFLVDLRERRRQNFF